jgi:double-stranded uracil-DNA glycosylase
VVLPNVLTPNLSVVFCGTAVGAASARRGAYYAGPGNRFWSTLFEEGFTPHLLKPEEFATLPTYGLGLTDLVKIVSGADAGLRRKHFDRGQLRDAITAHAPRVLAFNGKRAASEYLKRKVDYGAQLETIGATRLFVLPSTSGAARGFWRIEPWRELASLAAEDSDGSRTRTTEP